VKRREFITLLGGVAMWPVAARAQPAGMPVIGFLHPGSPNAVGHVVTFRQGLGEAGYIENRNVAIEFRWAEGRFDRLRELANDLAGRRVNVIVTPGSTIAALAAKAATTTIPIVFGVGDDPVKSGLVASLNKPGGNATGINLLSAEVASKRFGVLCELLPGAIRIAVLVNPASASIADTTLRAAEEAARAIGRQIHVLNASTSAEINMAFAEIVHERLDALFVSGDAFFNTRRAQLVGLAARHAVPAAYSNRDHVEAGGLMSYGTNLPDVYRQVGIYTGRVLNGAKPVDLPVLQSTKFELVINVQTANMLGLIVPSTLLARADEVIE
jgi:putative ABC transport system substrate-binding protein